MTCRTCDDDATVFACGERACLLDGQCSHDSARVPCPDCSRPYAKPFRLEEVPLPPRAAPPTVVLDGNVQACKTQRCGRPASVDGLVLWDGHCIACSIKALQPKPSERQSGHRQVAACAVRTCRKPHRSGSAWCADHHAVWKHSDERLIKHPGREAFLLAQATFTARLSMRQPGDD